MPASALRGSDPHALFFTVSPWQIDDVREGWRRNQVGPLLQTEEEGLDDTAVCDRARCWYEVLSLTSTTLNNVFTHVTSFRRHVASAGHRGRHLCHFEW